MTCRQMSMAWCGVLVLVGCAASAGSAAFAFGAVTLLAVGAALLAAPWIAVTASGPVQAWAGALVPLAAGLPVAGGAVVLGGVEPVRPAAAYGTAALLLGPVGVLARALPSARTGRRVVAALTVVPFAVLVPGLSLAEDGYRPRSEQHSGPWWPLAAVSPVAIVADATPLPGGEPAGTDALSHDPLGAVRIYGRCVRDPVRCEHPGFVSMADPLQQVFGHTYGGPPLWPYGLAFYGLLGVGAALVPRRALAPGQAAVAEHRA